MTLLALLFAAAVACTGEVEGRVVGFDPAGDRAVVRLESWYNDADRPGIALALLDLKTGNEAKRWSILPEGSDDAALRGRNWSKAEAELVAQGVVFEADRKPLWKETVALPDPVKVGPATLSFTLGYEGEGDDARRQLTVKAAVGEMTGSPVKLASWPTMAGGNAWHYVDAIWEVPGGKRAIVQTRQGCSEPGWHVVALDVAAP